MNWAELPLTVLKFGGTSVAGPERMKHVAGIVKKTREQGFRVAVVVSAMGNMTDDLLAMADNVANTKNGREMDQLLATGEQQSVALLSLALQQYGLPAQSFTALQAGIKAEGFPMEGRIYRIEPDAVEKVLNEGTVAVITGFVDSKPGISQMTDDTIHNHTLFLLCHSWCNFKFVACNALVWTNGTSALSIASEA